MPSPAPQTDLQTYLKDISRYPLLTATEEHTLAVEIRAKYAAYRKALGRKVTGGRLSKAARLALQDYSLARDRMVVANLRLVVSVAKRYANRGLTFLDLIEEGNIGLLKAVERFDPRMGTRFSTYATYWIRQSARRALVNTGQTVRIPVYMVEIIAKWKHASIRLAAKLGREPSLDEIADALDISHDKVGLIKRAVRGAAQGGSGSGMDATRSLNDLMADEREGRPEGTAFDASEREKISQLLNGIDSRESQILRMRFGFDDDKPKTLREIGKRLGVTRERVRQIESRTLRKLKGILTEDEWGVSPVAKNKKRG